MTKTNAKRGMVQSKVGYGKEALDWDYIKNTVYDETQITVHDVIQGVRSELKSEQLAHDETKNRVERLETDTVALNDVIARLEKKIADVETKYYEALKGVITR